MNEDLKIFSEDDLEEWYEKNIHLYSIFAKKVALLLEDILSTKGINYYSITYRSKGKESFLKKIEQKNYKDFRHEIQDLAGIRIITFVKSDVIKICELIEKEFKIDALNSADKTKELGEDRVGYRSVHYIAKLEDNRASLIEYAMLNELICEIQVRTLLEHAWADISHDRTYKFQGVLPEKNNIRRRFSLVAASLELIDLEFDRLSNEIEEYSREISFDTRHGKLEHAIDNTSLVAYLKEKFKEEIAAGSMDSYVAAENIEELIIEINGMGILSLSQLDEVIDRTINKGYKIRKEQATLLGTIRHILIIEDTKKYFENSYNHLHYSYMSITNVKSLEKFVKNIEEILKSNGITIL